MRNIFFLFLILLILHHDFAFSKNMKLKKTNQDQKEIYYSICYPEFVNYPSPNNGTSCFHRCLSNNPQFSFDQCTTKCCRCAIGCRDYCQTVFKLNEGRCVNICCGVIDAYDNPPYIQR